MPVGITTNVNCGLGKSKSKGQLVIYYKGGRYNKVGNGINQRLEKVDDPSIETTH